MKERKILFTAHSKPILRCLPFLLSFVFIFIPALNVDAAASSVQTLIDTREHYNLNQTQSYRITYSAKSEEIYLQNSGGTSTYSVTVGSSTDIDGRYQVFHIVQKFGAIGYMGLDNHTFDSFRIQSHVADRSISVTGSIYARIANVDPYLIVNASGHEYKSNIDYSDFYIDLPITGNFTIIPCVEYDVILELTHYEESTDYEIISADITSVFNSSSSVFNVFGINYTSTGEGGIIGAINNLLNGYQSNDVGQAESSFNTGAGDLTSIEEDLSDSSSTMVDTFTAEGFDASLLDSVAPSMQYLVTWFTNFWNIGGALTKCFTLCFALFIAFYILRVRS